MQSIHYLIIGALGVAIFFFACNSPEGKTNQQTSSADTLDKQWWKEAVVYQIYPRSFKDIGGFTTGAPWFKVNPNYATVNVTA
ncbi:MAG: hypothetical protein HUU34_14190 [Saprospiraceae bacterium]|jgi:hypothetical protein|nr:hypothetical protein [Saprospiraceae bacterium]